MLAIAPGWKLDVQRGPDWLFVRLSGPTPEPSGDVSDAPPLAKHLWALLEQHFTYRLVLDLEGLEVLNSHLIGQIVKLYKLIRQRDGVMRLCGLSPYNQQVLRSCRLDSRFWAYHDREEAVMGSRRTLRQPK